MPQPQPVGTPASASQTRPATPQQPQVNYARLAEVLASPHMTDPVKEMLFQRFLPEPEPKPRLAQLYELYGSPGEPFDAFVKRLEIAQRAPQKPTAYQREYARLIREGYDHNTASGIAGNYIKAITDPVTGQYTLIDERTGQPFAYAGQVQEEAPAQPTRMQQLLAPPDIDIAADAVSGPRAMVEQLEQGVMEAEKTGTPLDDAFGVSGAAQDEYYDVMGSVGLEREDSEEFAEKVQSVESSAKRVLGGLARAVNPSGRVSNWTLQLAQRQIPETGRMFESAANAVAKLKTIRGDMVEQIRLTSKQLQNPYLQRRERFELEADRDALWSAARQIEFLLSRFKGYGDSDSTGTGDSTRSGDSTGRGVTANGIEFEYKVQ